MMLLSRRPLVTLGSAATMLALMSAGFSLGAQESSAKKSEPSRATKAAPGDSSPSKESPGKTAGKVTPPDPAHRLPQGYAKLDLSDEQREAIYKIQGKYYPQIQALEKQVATLREKREAECEAVLKPAQKRLLTEQEQQRKAAAAAKKATARTAREKS